MLERIAKLSFKPASTDWGLLVLRIGVGLTLFLKHGYEKVSGLSEMAPHFFDPLHLGGPTTLFIAMLSDGVCSLLVVIGLATRAASLFSFATIFVAWALVHGFMLFGNGSEHGEVIWLFLAGMIAVFIAGPGRYSIDFLLKG